MTNTRRPEHAFIVTAALVFAASTAVTIAWCSSMSAMPGMEMPGGWTMSMTWMRMPGQSWFGAAATFLGMWVVMMIAMMMPVLVPMLSRRRSAFGTVAGYFFVWTLCGAMVFPFGIAIAEWVMRVPPVARAAPMATGIVLVLAGATQFSAWKMRQLACCRTASRCELRGDINPWRHGLRLGLDCVLCCAGPTGVLLAVGVMDLRAMAFVTVAISAERLAPRGELVARVFGAIAIAIGLLRAVS